MKFAQLTSKVQEFHNRFSNTWGEMISASD